MSHFLGPVPIGSGAYIDRPFEKRLIQEVMAGHWVLLLGPRQHGKTSALIRANRRLCEAGLATALVDLQRTPPLDSFQDLVTWISTIICKQLQTAISPESFGDDLISSLSACLPRNKLPVVIFIDEASNISNAAWRNSFYGQLRAISSQRASAREDEPAARLRFVFAGTFRHESLIDEANSPFNVCERVDTDDLSEKDVVELSVKELGEDAVDIGKWLYSEVGGQPFLIQKLLYSGRGSDAPRGSISAALEELQLGGSDHIEHLFQKVLSTPSIKDAVASMARDGSIPNEPANTDFRYMQVMGMGKREGKVLKFRNKLYASVALASPQLIGPTGARSPKQGHAPLFPLTCDSFSGVVDERLKEIALAAQRGAVSAYLANSHKIALAGFGSSMEAMLIDYLSRKSGPDLKAAVTVCKWNKFEDPQLPETWRLVNLVAAARRAGKHADLEVPDALRDWRNLIHPGVCLKKYNPDSHYEPEVRTAAGLHAMLLRDLK